MLTESPWPWAEKRKHLTLHVDRVRGGHVSFAMANFRLEHNARTSFDRKPENRSLDNRR